MINKVVLLLICLILFNQIPSAFSQDYDSGESQEQSSEMLDEVPSEESYEDPTADRVEEPVLDEVPSEESYSDA